MSHLTRRELLRTAGAGAMTLALAPLTSWAADEKPSWAYELPKLPYAFDALNKAIDAQTMEIHHDRHHKAYVDNLNKALADQPNFQGKPIADLVRMLKPGQSPPALVNNGGGHANHTMFWEMMSPQGGSEPSGELAKAIDASFGSFAKFQEQLTQAAMTRFGSGWAWLVVADGKLKVTSTANQDCPLMLGQDPLLGVDVWEHAYYLRYQNKRADYVKAWWQVVNWKDAAERYNMAKKG